MSIIQTFYGRIQPRNISAQVVMACAFLIMLSFFGCSSSKDLPVVDNVDLNRYAGKWYEIAAFPQKFQKGCSCTTAEYTVLEDGTVRVENKCMKDGKQSGITGKAFVAKGGNKAKLKVQFFWPLRGDYWIIDLAPDYSYALVGHPNRDYLWVLSRTSKMDDATYQALVNKASTLGFDTSRLVKTTQTCN